MVDHNSDLSVQPSPSPSAHMHHTVLLLVFIFVGDFVSNESDSPTSASALQYESEGRSLPSRSSGGPRGEGAEAKQAGVHSGILRDPRSRYAAKCEGSAW